MSRLERKNAVTIGEALHDFLREARLSSDLNRRRIYSAWDKASGASAYTIRRHFKDGKLYITLKSSVARTQLSFQKQAIIDRMNALLLEDEMFFKDDPDVNCITELILK